MQNSPGPSQARRWRLLLLVAVAAVILAVVTATGGLASAGRDDGPRLAAAEPVRLSTWTVVVHEAEVRHPHQGSAEVQVRVRADLTNLGEKTETTLPDMILLDLPPGHRPVRPEARVRGRGIQYDPGVPEPVWLQVSYSTPPPLPATVRIVVRDLRWSEGFLDGSWVPATVAGHIDLPLRDRRHG